jgi:acetyl-CoA carboxylase beta subunit
MSNKYKYQCESCGFNTNYKSKWEIHISSELHKTGKKKIRSDKICIEKCPECDYESKINTNMRQHILINHGTKEEREKEFTYYCKYCDYGTFAKSLYQIHKRTKKHKQIVELLSKIVEV